MEMLNIPPAKPQSKQAAPPKSKTGKDQNTSFHNALGKANQNAQKDPHKGVENSTDGEAREPDGTAQFGNKVAEDSQPVSSTEGEEQTTEPSAEDSTPAEFAMGTVPSLPVAAVQTEPVPNGSIVSANVNSEKTASLVSEDPLQRVPAEVGSTTQTASDATTPHHAVPDAAQPNELANSVAPVAERGAVATDSNTVKATPPQEASAAMAAEKNVADSTLPAGLAHGKASVDPRQNVEIPANAAAAITQVNPATTSEQTNLASGEDSKKPGLMESSLGNLLQDVKPLREQSRGRQAANLNRGETASLAISGEEPAQVVAKTQNEDSHPSFASKQENGFSTVPADAATNGSHSAINATPFEAVLEGGMHGSPTTQQTSQPLQATSAEPGSIRLASGEFLSENQIVNQVLERITIERAGNQSRIVVKMNPEELGEVKLALTMDKDQLRAQLLTQNHQVQEILEKHLPKLHEALSQQGLKLEDIQVGVDSNRHSGRETFADHRQPDRFHRHQNAPVGTINNDPLQSATASTHSVSTQGLSLRI